MTLAILLLISAGFCVLGTLVLIANPKVPGGSRAWITAYNAGLVVVMILSALKLMSGK